MLLESDTIKSVRSPPLAVEAADDVNVRNDAKERPGGSDARAMKARSLSKWKVRLAFGSAVAILLGVGAFSYRVIAESEESSRWVQHSRDVIRTINLTQLSMEFIASSVRGFAITGNKSYFDIYRVEEAALKRHLAELGDLTADNPAQKGRASNLEKLANERFGRAAKVVALRRDQGVDAAADEIRKGPGPWITTNFQKITREMQVEEARLFALRNAAAKKDLSQTKTILIAGTLLGLLITGAAGWSVLRDATKRGRVEQALRDSEEQYRTLVQAVEDYAIFMLDPQGRLSPGMPEPNESKVTAPKRSSVITIPASLLRKTSSSAGRRRYSGWLRQAAGTMNKPCACEGMAHNIWRMSPS